MSISHAIVLPDWDFEDWLAPVRPYMAAFERVAVLRSAGGNDLNRFHTITAVQAARVWMQDDALLHIRRVYPMVVRVDVIPADTPEQLGAVLNRRIAFSDRYGERDTAPRHLFTRFVVGWPTAARPARILRDFASPTDRSGDTHMGIDISARPGGTVTCGAAGSVRRLAPGGDGLGIGPYVQVESLVDDQRSIVTYAGLRDFVVNEGQVLAEGDALGAALGDQIKLIVQQPGQGISGMALPDVVDPVDMIYWPELRLRPNVRALRVRSMAGVHGETVSIVRGTDLLESHETHGRTLLKVGQQDKWLRVRHAAARTAYCAAWYLDAVGTDDPIEAIPGIQVPGVNLDVEHALGTPDPAPLAGLGWVRFRYNVSLNPSRPEGDPARYGNTDLQATFNRYSPILARYRDAGLKVILVLTHQTYGEGQGYVWPQMDSGRWRDLSGHFVTIVRQIAAQFRNTGLVSAYQIWNEQDTAPEHARAAVPMPASDYAYLLGETVKAIRSVDPEMRILTGGHASGPSAGTVYAQQTLADMPRDRWPDGIAFHPYGRGPADNPFSRFGTISDSVRKWLTVMPGKPVWITEWGVLDRQGDDSIASQVTAYASGFLESLRLEFPGQVAAALWYAWADSMDNGYGLVRTDQTPREPLYGVYLK